LDSIRKKESFEIEVRVIEELLRLERGIASQYITLFNQKDAPASYRHQRNQSHDDKMQVDEGNSNIKEFLDLSLSKRVTFKT